MKPDLPKSLSGSPIRSHFDRRLLAADVRGSQAFARSLTRAGVLTDAECAMLCEAFDAIQAGRGERRAFFDGADDEDVHSFVIHKLKERVGALADKIHTGRSRNEQVSLDTRLWLRDECDRTRELVRALMSALLDLAAKYPDAVIPGLHASCGARSRFCGRTICWRILKCWRATTSGWAMRGDA